MTIMLIITGTSKQYRKRNSRSKRRNNKIAKINLNEIDCC